MIRRMLAMETGWLLSWSRFDWLQTLPHLDDLGADIRYEAKMNHFAAICRCLSADRRSNLQSKVYTYEMLAFVRCTFVLCAHKESNHGNEPHLHLRARRVLSISIL